MASLGTHLSLSGFSNGNPDQAERLVANTPGLNGDDIYAKFLHRMNTLRLEKLGPF